MTESKKLSLHWELHENHRTSALKSLWKTEDFVDLTLACDDGHILAHQVVLSASSPTILRILRQSPQKNPFIYLRGIKKQEIETLLEFIYCGKALVRLEDLSHFIEIAKDLKVEGLDLSAEERPNINKEMSASTFPPQDTNSSSLNIKAEQNLWSSSSNEKKKHLHKSGERQTNSNQSIKNSATDYYTDNNRKYKGKIPKTNSQFVRETKHIEIVRYTNSGNCKCSTP